MFLYLLTLFFFVFFFLLMKKSHVLAMLIGVEYLVVLLALVYCSSCLYLSLVFFIIVFMTFSVCESVLGLVLFVIFSRSFSKDYVRFLNIVFL